MVIKDSGTYWSGTTSDDILVYESGSDKIDGKLGADTLSINATKGSAKVSTDSAGITYVNFNGGTNYTHYSLTLTNIEKIAFSDGDVTLNIDSTLPYYNAIISKATVNEGASFLTSVTTRNVSVGTLVYWSFFGSGITQADFSSGEILGSGIVGTDGKLNFSHTLSNDLTSEGTETLLVKLFSDVNRTLEIGTTASITINDTSYLKISGDTKDIGIGLVNNNQIYAYTGEVDATKLIGYRFAIEEPCYTYITLGGFSDDLDLYLYKDNDRYPNTLLSSSEQQQLDPENVFKYLMPGNYLAFVRPYESKSSSTDYRLEIDTKSFTANTILPNDPLFANQWYLLNTGQANGEDNWDVKAPEAWFSAHAAPDVIIAVIDSGIDYFHPDLDSNIWINAKEIAGNGIDDDHNNYVDDIGGWDFVGNDNDPRPGNQSNIHGTHVAGIIGAEGNNGLGIAGIAWDVQLMNLKVFPDDSKGASLDDICEAIRYAADNGADVINLSLGQQFFFEGGFDEFKIQNPSVYTAYFNALKHASDKGVTIVAAAGNNSLSNDIYSCLPADFSTEIPGMLSVAAISNKGQKSSYSNYGNVISIAAPGGNHSGISTQDILSTIPGGKYDYIAGTSMAAPIVAGAAALLIGKNPNLTPDQIKSLLMAEADKMRSLEGLVDSGNFLNIYASLNAASSSEDNNLGSIMLVVSPSSVAEDSAPNLIYTFTRTGPTTNALTVNYGITGTAVAGDYSGATPGTDKTITFAANSATATLAIDPTADTTIETDETVALTLASGTGYTIGTTTAVVGTISNDDTPTPTYILTPSATSVNEGSSISYNLTTTNVASGTSLYYQFSGTGTNAADFSTGTTSGTEVVGTNGQLSISRTLVADKTTEGTESLTLRVFTDAGATTALATNSAVTVNDTSLTQAKPTQQVYTQQSEITYKPAGTAVAPLLYTTSSGDANLSGLTLNLHYNSSILTPSGSNNGVSGQLPAAITSTTILADTNNLDNDPLTDKIIRLVWATFDSSFPNKTLPASLAMVSFSTSATKTDALTGQPLSTTVRYTAPETASGYDFITGSTLFKAQQFNLDVDGDGKVTALGDGLMVIRKLFGAAFAGDALTNKAISPNATRTTAEINDFIQGGIDGGMLDVDKDGKTTALGDGLMVIRRLFGAAFDGAALTNKAIGPNSPYFGQATDFSSVGINIDALKPNFI